MALRLTHKNLPAAYEFVRACFPNWRLPEADDIGFEVSRSKTCAGNFLGERYAEHSTIAISDRCVGSALGLIGVMSHEAIHLKQFRDGTETPGVQHNAEFLRLARQACRALVLDFKAFV